MKEAFVYRINDEDIITSVSDNWNAFAEANDWGDAGRSVNVLGRLLWDFINDAATRHLYLELFKRVRTGKFVGPIPFRCDSPHEKRFLELLILPLPDSHIEITSTIMKSESHGPVRLLDSKAPRSSELVRICSMCKKIAMPHNEWVELEEGVARLRLFEADEMPQLTHGLCLPCYHVAIADINQAGPPSSKT